MASSTLAEAIAEVRVQSGFFVAEALGILVPTFRNLAINNGLVRFLIGSNGSGTIHDDVRRLAELLGLPRPNSTIGVVSYSNAFFHPKVYHFRRNDGSQCAYVGSANLTPPGLSSLHVEAGMLLDTRDDDPVQILNSIAAAIDVWFTTERTGFYLVEGIDAIDVLLAQGILAAAQPPPPPRPASSGSGVRNNGARPTLHPLMTLPPVPGLICPAPPEPPPDLTPTGNVSAVRENFPGYILFAPDPHSPTSGTAALSGATLPGGAVGLIIRLNNDSARHFENRPGTANISVPVATLLLVIFGIYGSGAYSNRPRAEYELLLRYVGAKYSYQFFTSS